jgi:hypothetical protein
MISIFINVNIINILVLLIITIKKQLLYHILKY